MFHWTVQTQEPDGNNEIPAIRPIYGGIKPRNETRLYLSKVSWGLTFRAFVTIETDLIACVNKRNGSNFIV